MSRVGFGPRTDAGLTRFRLYAPDAAAVALERDGAAPVPMAGPRDGFFTTAVAGLAPGTRYRFRVGAGDDALTVPDPASRAQAADADGWSLVPAPHAPRPAAPLRPWHEAVIAEVHVGTATPEGTFRALIGRLDHYRDAGFTVIELMPVADFTGRRNWGYDGVLLYAPDTAYGTPDDLRALVEAAHDRGLGMMLDVVYNHFGPSGNYLPAYARAFFREDIATPWGPAIDLGNPVVRAFFTENAAYWLAEFGFDGLRFDAVHALATDSAKVFLVELASACRAVRPDAWLVLENHDNIAEWLVDGRSLYTAQWNDDWHHAFHVLASGESGGYYRPYARDALGAAARALAEGFVFQGERYPDDEGFPRGTRSRELPPTAFVAFVQNHDHIGNRPLGDRLAGTLDRERLAFLRFVLMLCPQIPLLFQGEEALLDKPFPFFCDFAGDLGEAVRTGRRGEFPDFFRDHDAGSFPDPLDEATFRAATLRAEDFETAPAREELAAFRALADTRRALVWPLTDGAFVGADMVRETGGLLVTWHFAAGSLAMALNPTAAPARITVAAGVAGTEPAARVGDVALTADGALALGAFAAAVWRLARP
ncbi:malto-oligosyltrehalose trehalohydrolase [Ancylobacter terrae]|uniref:malto-oligosyltrehalose trehalohydrolase n=1 Tax=Ancylobacter sp. sgz301288 TaxID=3342077 RepID=UPI00385CCBAA